jgi:hypothetical protein
MALKLFSLGRAKQPLPNEYSTSLMFESSMRQISESLYKQIRQSPELLRILDTIVTDHFMGPVDFFDTAGRPLGPTKVKQILRFWHDENVQNEAFYGQAIDFFVDGSCFGWHVNGSSVLSVKQKEAIAKLKQFSFKVGEEMEQSASMPRKISYIAASTTTIKFDDGGIKYYVQDAAGKRVRWDVDQIVHIRNMNFNGEMRGMSPLKALTKEIVMMFLLKENILAKLENGGSPDSIIAMKGANGVAKARFERFRSAMESFSHLRKSHGNMIVDTDVTVHKMGADLKDMEYRELAMFVISEYALALGLPTSRIPFLMTGSGGPSNKGELSGNSEDSYQSAINSRRMNWENAWNKVFRRAGFTFKFRRDNLQDDIRETQASMQRAEYVSKVQSSLYKSGKQLRLSSQLALLSGSKMNISEEDIEDVDLEGISTKLSLMEKGHLDPVVAGQGGPMQPSNIQSRSRVTQARSAAKKATANNNGVFV